MEALVFYDKYGKNYEMEAFFRYCRQQNDGKRLFCYSGMVSLFSIAVYIFTAFDFAESVSPLSPAKCLNFLVNFEVDELD